MQGVSRTATYPVRQEASTDEHPAPYVLLRQIGSGGMATVFEAVDSRLGHRVAIKRLHPHIAARPGANERFLREGRAAARIRHPHVVHVLALGRDETSAYLAMELLDGCDLAALLARAPERRLGVEEALALLLPVFGAVAAAHDAGVLHRDLKPSNVFISRGPGHKAWPKVIDFGVSKVLDGDAGDPPTATDGIVGTAAYIAPEQARHSREATFASDQYSLAVILYQCVTGSLPFSASNVIELLVAMMTAPLVSPSQRVSGIPPGFDEILLRAMNRDSRERFGSVRAFGAKLLAFAREADRFAFAAELRDDRDTAIPVEVDIKEEGEPVAPDGAASVAPRTERDTTVKKTARLARRALAVLGIGSAAIGWMIVRGARQAPDAGASSREWVTSRAPLETMAFSDDSVPAPSADFVTVGPSPARSEQSAATPKSAGPAERRGAQPVVPFRLPVPRAAPRVRDAGVSIPAAPQMAIAARSIRDDAGAPVPLAIGDNGAPILP